MSFEKDLKAALTESLEQIKNTKFYQDLSEGINVKAIYKAYLYHAYHYVINTSAFTPLAARRMGREHVRIRKWILQHSGEEMGHELMALRDLELLGENKQEVVKGEIPIGVIAWISFFHYKVSQANPWSMFGVLYFLEGMAQALAPEILKPIINGLAAEEKNAITFFKEHGELDHDHMEEQEALLFSAKLQPAHEKAIIQTLKEAAQIKVYMLDTLMRNLR